MYPFFLSIILVAIIHCSAHTQIRLDSISHILISDYVNWNYETVNSVEYKIDVQNKRAFYITGRMPKAQFVATRFKAKRKKLRKQYIKSQDAYYQADDSMAIAEYKVVFDKFWRMVDTAYTAYHRILKPRRIGKLSRKKLGQLIDALNQPAVPEEQYYPLEQWVEKNKYRIKDYIKEEALLPLGDIDAVVDTYTYETIPALEVLDTFTVQMAMSQYSFWRRTSYSYYPRISIWVYTMTNDTFYFENNSQKTPPMPWDLYQSGKRTTYDNIAINHALFKILPAHSKLNRKRLKPSIPYKSPANPLVRYFATEIIEGIKKEED